MYLAYCKCVTIAAQLQVWTFNLISRAYSTLFSTDKDIPMWAVVLSPCLEIKVENRERSVWHGITLSKSRYWSLMQHVIKRCLQHPYRLIQHSWGRLYHISKTSIYFTIHNFSLGTWYFTFLFMAKHYQIIYCDVACRRGKQIVPHSSCTLSVGIG